MSLISKQIANLFNGVSQQTPALRLPSQADAQENCFSSLVLGLHKRQPTEYVSQIYDTPLVKPKVHTINRDANEKYQVVMTNGDLKVFDLKTGAEKTVSFPNGKDYLKSTNPRDELRAMTVEDYTFITNRNIRPAMAVTPYLSTDQVTATVNFGDGTLGEEQVIPRVGGQFKFYMLARDNSTGQLKWVTNNLAYETNIDNLWDTFTDFLDVFYSGAGGSAGVLVNDFVPWPVITKDNTGNPKWTDTPVGSNYLDYPVDTTRMFGIIGEQNKDFPVLLNVGGHQWDCKLRIAYRWNDSHSDPLNTQAALRPYVGYPLASSRDDYHLPGVVWQERIMPVFDGKLFLSVNNKIYSKGHENGWTATDYLSYFYDLISTDFPDLTLSVNEGWQLVIQAPAGQQVYVSSWDTRHRGYIKTVYSDLPQQEAVFIVIKNGVAEQTYSVSINGHQYDVTTGATEDVSTYKVDTIANDLAAEINAGGIFQAAVYGNFIKVIHPSKVPMTFASHDTWNDQAMYAMKNRVQAFEDLPAKFIPGYPIEVAGVDGSSGFYVHYTLKGAKPPKAYGLERQVTVDRPLGTINPAGSTWNAIEADETGLWEECAKPGVPDVLIPYTMPHVLISNADGSFTFKEVDWFRRPVGDYDTVPAPSFVGKEFQDIFFFRNRLGFLTEETVIMSRAGEFFNFWPQTARDVLDSDSIDVQVNHTKVAKLRWSVVYNNSLALFSDNTQFIVSGQQILSPKTIAVQPSTEFEASYKCKPVNVGTTVNFIAESDNWSNCWEYYIEANSVSNTAANTTAHCPKYLPKDIWKMAASPNLDMLVAVTDREPNKMYVYKFAWGPEGKIQQSWSRWTFKGDILNMDFVDGSLSLTMGYPEGVYLEEINLRLGAVDEDLQFLVNLDRKVKLTGFSTGSGISFTPGYPVTEDISVVNALNGLPVNFVVDGDSVVVTSPGASVVYIGYPYEMFYRFSPIYMKDNQNIPILGSTLMLKSFSVQYENTAQFNLEVTPERRNTYINKFISKIIGSTAVLNAIAPSSGTYKAVVAGEGKTTTIAVRSYDHYPVFLQSAHWEADYTTRARKT